MYLQVQQWIQFQPMNIMSDQILHLSDVSHYSPLYLTNHPLKQLKAFVVLKLYDGQCGRKSVKIYFKSSLECLGCHEQKHFKRKVTHI